MNEAQTFEQFLATESVQLPVFDFALNIVLAAALAYILGLIYDRFGSSLSNRRSFANNFMMLAMTTMLIISVVKSSIALSLGLVGALSIVRFRAAIKEPEELTYLFLTIGIGLGLGADQRLVTVVAFALIVGIIILKHYRGGRVSPENLYLTVGTNGHNRLELDAIVDVLRRHCTDVDLRRFDEDKDQMQASFKVRFPDFTTIKNSKAELQRLNDSIRISFLDNRGIGGLE